MVETLFVELVRSFVYDRFALDPVSATVAGVHAHDHELGDLTAEGFAARRAFSEEWLTRLRDVGEGLSPAQEIDRDLMLSDLRGDRALFAFERWRRDPGLYPSIITRGAYYGVTREYSPMEERLADTGRHAGVTVLDALEDLGDEERIAARPFVQGPSVGAIYSRADRELIDLIRRKTLEVDSRHARITSQGREEPDQRVRPRDVRFAVGPHQ